MVLVLAEGRRLVGVQSGVNFRRKEGFEWILERIIVLSFSK
jgi:hypothetical protein